MKLHLAPAPSSVASAGGYHTLARDRTIVIACDGRDACMAGARALRDAIDRYAGGRWEIRAASGLAEREGAVAVIDRRAVRQREGYHLTIGDERIGIVAHDTAGIQHAFSTLTQIVRQCGRRLPRLHIEDAPAFAHRGVMLDISRDKVPTMQTLYGLVDMLAGWKINQFQLYMEHTFAYQQHRAVWKDASPLTGEEVLALDAYCRARHIDLVPNQNSFGHMARWLEHKPYNGLAEAPRGTTLPWGKLPPFTLDPADHRSIELVEGLYAELLPHFTSRLFNVGCDETFDLGRGKSADAVAKRGAGRVYLDFLLKVHALCARHDRQMMFWGDIILQHPELIPELPRDVIALEWGYEHDHPFRQDAKAFRGAGVQYYVCPGAGGWNSLIGRLDNAVENIRNATTNGKRHGASGVLNTEWGDNGHMQPLAVAWPGMLYGAAMSWSPRESASLDLAAALSLHAFDDPSGATGRAAVELGNAYQVNGAKTRNGSLLAQLYFLPLDNEWPMSRVRPGGFGDTRDHIASAIERVDAANMRREDAGQVARELRCAARMASAGATIGEAKHVRASGGSASRERAAWKRAARSLADVTPEYERLWLARNRPGGLRDSVARIDALVAALRKAAG